MVGATITCVQKKVTVDATISIQILICCEYPNQSSEIAGTHDHLFF